MIILETERLILRQWQDSDIPQMVDINADEQVMRFFPGTQDETRTRALIQKARDLYTKYGWGFYACQRRDSGAFIGTVGLSMATFEADFTPCIEILWRISSDHWGQGFAPEAAGAIVDDALNNRGIPEVVAFTPMINTPSIRVMQKIGMIAEPQRDFDHPLLPPEHPLRRHVFYAVTQS